MKTTHNRVYNNIPVGIAIRGSIDNDRTFRVRPGNGHYSAIEGEVYQDQYTYFVPGSINNAASQPYRQQWIAAVHKWRYDLTTDEKEAYNTRANRIRFLSGYNLFIREAMKGVIDMYVDRGDPAAVDFVIGDLTIDGAWHTLDLSSIITVSARAVLFCIDFDNQAANKHIELKQNGNINDINHFKVATKVAAQDEHSEAISSPDTSRLVAYKIDSGGWNAIDIVVRGWWT